MLFHENMGDNKGNKKAIPTSYAPSFEIEINELSGILTQVGFNPNRDIEEDR